MCSEECSRLHTEQLMLELLWVWDYVCYPITSLDRIWGLQEFSLPGFLHNWHMKILKLSALHTVAFIPKETSLALIYFRGSVDPRATVRSERNNKLNSQLSPRDSNSRHFGLKCNASPKYAKTCPILSRVWGPLNESKELNVNPSLSSIRYQNTGCWYPIYIQTYQYISTGSTFKTDQTVCEMQTCVWKCCWNGTWGKIFQSVLIQNSDTLKDMYYDVCAIYPLRKQ